MTEFEGWLRKGLGRAAVFLQKNDSRPYREPLLYACTHDLTYDRQCEERRGRYLIDLIVSSRDEKFYRDGIFDALENGGEDLDTSQIFEIAGHFAREGDSLMKRAMYTAFEPEGYLNMGLCAAEELVRLDGLKGLRFAMKAFGEEPAEDRPWQFRSLLKVLKEGHGKQPLPEELDRFRKESEQDERKWSNVTGGATPSADELAAAAGNLLKESHEKRLISSLRLFRRHIFPGPIDRLLSLVRSENRHLARAAVMALSNVTDPRVRDLGLTLIAEKNSAGVRLLVRNAEPGDYELIEGLLNSEFDADVLHGLGFDIREYADAHKSPEAERSLLFLYEHGPCSLCRTSTVHQLIDIARLPAWMPEECRYDACSDTRQLVSSLQ